MILLEIMGHKIQRVKELSNDKNCILFIQALCVILFLWIGQKVNAISAKWHMI